MNESSSSVARATLIVAVGAALAIPSLYVSSRLVSGPAGDWMATRNFGVVIAIALATSLAGLFVLYLRRADRRRGLREALIAVVAITVFLLGLAWTLYGTSRS